jgi:hypothetical protein
MKHMKWLVPALLLAVQSHAKMDLVTLPERDTVQLTIYNSADLTLVRESRALTLQNGKNKLQFSWENTLIDPTSLGLLPLREAGKIDVSDLTYPPRVKNLGLWTINSRVNGKVPVEITYLTSGISWRAFYMGTLTPDEKQMRLEGYVRVANNSGEDYANAKTRLIVGQVNMIDQIASLAQRQHPYGSPVPMPQPGMMGWGGDKRKGQTELAAPMVAFAAAESAVMDIKEIKKEGLSEYFLYTIEGRETIENGWSKRLPSFEAGEVPVVNLYKYEEDRYGQSVMRFLSFKNDEKHKLGETPIPGGMLKVYRDVGQASHLSYEGQSEFKYIPVGEDVELELGGVRNVVVEPKVMAFKTDDYSFNQHGDVDGWVEVRNIQFEVKNTREIPVKVEITRNLGTRHWSVENQGECGTYEKVDLDTVKYTLELAPRTTRQFTQMLTTRHGRRAE